MSENTDNAPVSEDSEEPRAVSYRVLTGLSYGNKRAEVGDIVDDIPAKSVKWLLADNHIEKVS